MVVKLGRRYIAVDWGTTNRRTYLIEDGQLVRTDRDNLGVTAVTKHGFEREIAVLRTRFGNLPMLLAGMVGSTIGWREVPYVRVPAGLIALADGLCPIDDRTAIVPGLSFVDGANADVMRGEEVQLLGATAAALVPPDAFLCQPGTHCKWAEMKRGDVARFTTAMTGELFALIRAHGLLAAQLGGPVSLGTAFDQGVAEGARRDLAASLFGIRAAHVLGRRDAGDAASFASGLLIGGDVAARLTETRHGTIHVLADPGLGALYAAAIEAQGRTAVIVDSHAAFIAGVIHLGKLIS